IFTDPALGTNTDFPDYGAFSIVVPFAANQCRATVTINVANDSVVEFNEDIIAFLEHIPGELPVNPEGSMANVTILFDDQPAGALDREWNPDNIERTL